jgi:hypothetical protein
MVNPLLAFVDNSLLIWHTVWSDTDGNYGYPGYSKSGDTPVIDYGDGTIEPFTGSHTYADGSTKTVKLSSTDGWSGLTEFRLNWGKCNGALPTTELLINLVKYVCDTNQFTGSIPNFDDCPLLEEFHVEGNQITGSVPSFALCTALKYFYIHYNGGLSGNLPSFATCIHLKEFYSQDDSGLNGTLPSFNACTELERLDIGNCGFTGTMPSFNACVSLISFHASSCHFSGTLPDFSGCVLMESFMAANNSLTDYTAGSLSTQPSLSEVWLNDNALSESAVDSVLADLVDSLSLGGRVSCYVHLSGGTNASPSSMADHDTLEAAGWTVDVN